MGCVFDDETDQGVTVVLSARVLVGVIAAADTVGAVVTEKDAAVADAGAAAVAEEVTTTGPNISVARSRMPLQRVLYSASVVGCR